MKKVVTLLIIIVSLIGLADASYLTYKELMGVLPTCGGGFDCGKVLSSEYAHIGPIPVCVLGMLFYTAILVLASAQFLEIEITKKLPLPSKLKLNNAACIFLICFSGLFFTGYLIYLMAFVLQSWCLFCLISATSCTTLFVLSWLNKKMNQTSNPY